MHSFLDTVQFSAQEPRWAKSFSLVPKMGQIVSNVIFQGETFFAAISRHANLFREFFFYIGLQRYSPAHGVEERRESKNDKVKSKLISNVYTCYVPAAAAAAAVQQ